MKRLGTALVLLGLTSLALADALNLISGSLLVEEPLEFYIQATSTSRVTQYQLHLECETPVSGFVTLGDSIIGRFSAVPSTYINKELPESGTYRLTLNLAAPATCTQFTLSSSYFQFAEALPPEEAASGAANGAADTLARLEALAAELDVLATGPTGGANRLASIEAELRSMSAEPCCPALTGQLAGVATRLRERLLGAEPVNGLQLALGELRQARFAEVVQRMPRGYERLELPAREQGRLALAARTVETSFSLGGRAASLMITFDASDLPVAAFVSGALAADGPVALTSLARRQPRSFWDRFWTRFWSKRQECLEIEDRREREQCIDDALIEAFVETVEEGL